jgi:hypothetical protein
MKTLFSITIALSVLTGFAASACAYDQRTRYDQVFSTGQGG